MNGASTRFWRWTIPVLLLLAGLPFALPLLWLVSTAFKTPAAIYHSPPQWLPQPPTLQNFSGAWGLLDFPRFFANSLLITALSMLAALFTSSLVGFAFAVIPARGKPLLFAMLLSTIMIPASVTLIPLFILYSRLGWIDTYLPLLIPQLGANAFYVFLFRQFYRSLPEELFESAELDGCNPWQSYWRIALPLSRPALATVAVFAFLGAWNDFQGPLVYLNSPQKFTLALGLSFFQGLYYTQIHYLMAMAMLALLPVLLLFLVAQRHFMQGIAAYEPPG
jgi:multiple sugar transport system permease protein